MVIKSPRPGDLVLGGQGGKTAPTQALVLGGIPGLSRRLWHPNAAVRMATRPEIVALGEGSIDLLIEIVASHWEWSLRVWAWEHLRQSRDPQAQRACQTYSPFRPVGTATDLLVYYLRGQRDFSYADLAGFDLSGARLGGINLFHAHAQHSVWCSSNLNGAQLGTIDLRGANLQGAKLSGATLQGADLRGANVQGAKLSGTNLRQSRIDDQTQWDVKARLVWEWQNQMITGRRFVGIDLSKADLQGLDLQGYDLRQAHLAGVDLRGCLLRGATLQGANLQRADLRGCSLEEIDLQGALLNKADLRGANLQQALLQNSDCSQADLRGVSLINARIEGMKHEDSRITGVIFPDGSRMKPWWW